MRTLLTLIITVLLAITVATAFAAKSGGKLSVTPAGETVASDDTAPPTITITSPAV